MLIAFLCFSLSLSFSLTLPLPLSPSLSPCLFQSLSPSLCVRIDAEFLAEYHQFLRCTHLFTGTTSPRGQRVHWCTKIHLFETIWKWQLYRRNIEMRMKQNIVDGACIVDFCALKDVTMRSVPRQWSRSPVPFSSMNHRRDLLLLGWGRGGWLDVSQEVAIFHWWQLISKKQALTCGNGTSCGCFNRSPAVFLTLRLVQQKFQVNNFRLAHVFTWSVFLVLAWKTKIQKTKKT